MRLSTILLLGSLFLTAAPPGFALESVLPSGEVLNLYGIGVHQEKRNDIYLGSIFTAPGVETLSQIINVKSNKRMSFKFLSKYSNRKMSRLLKQRISMNNSKDQWRPYTKEIVQFTKLFKRSLLSGDEVKIDYLADKGTQIYLNNTLFLTVEKPGFYPILLNIWFGSIPPSESFKTGINGNNTDYLNDELIAKYNALQPEVGRFDADKIVAEPETKTKLAKTPTIAKSPTELARKTINNTAQKKASPADLAEKSESTKSSLSLPNLAPALVAVNSPNILLDSLPTVPALEKQEITETLQKSVDQDRVNTEKDTPQVSEQTLEDAATSESDSESKLVSDNKPTENKTAIPQANQTAPVQDEVTAEKFAKLESPEALDLDLISGSYTKELFALVRAKQRYPQKAHREGIQGKLVVRITIDKEGEVIDQQILQRSGSRVLDRGVLKMLRRTGPFPKIPEELNLEEFTVELPLSFQFSE